MAPRVKKYTEFDLKNAIEKILKEGWTISRSANTYEIPWTTIRKRLLGDPKVVKIGRSSWIYWNQDL